MNIVKASSPVPTYFLLLVLSIVIVTIGLVLDNAAVVIGGMLVSPLLSPILSLGMGVVISDMKLIYRSGYVLLKSLAIVVAISIFIAWISDFELNAEITSRVNPSLSYFYVAIASGVAAAFSYIKEEFEERLVGVAVAIALLPPLSVTGIGIALLNPEIVFGSLELFAANLIGIVLATVIVFSLFGFYTVKGAVAKELKVEKKELEQYEKEKKEAAQEIAASVLPEDSKEE